MFLGIFAHAQMLEKIMLSDYDLKGSVLSAQVMESSWSAAGKSFQKEKIFNYQFDTNGYVTRSEMYNSINKMTYSKGYTQQTIEFKDGKSRTSTIIKTPARSFLTNTFDVIKNANGTVQKVTDKPDGTVKDAKDLVYNFTYENGITIIQPSTSFVYKQRFTSDGLLISEENDLVKSYFFYHPKSKLLTQKISKTKYSTMDVYYINSYEYDKYGNWIVCYNYSSIPSISNAVNPFQISTRAITYKNNEKTGYETISGIQKLRGAYYGSSKMVNKLDTNNPYSFPVYIDYDFSSSSAATSVEVANTPSSPSAPVAASNCKGNCVDGFGKYTYDNGYYYGFWKNGQKNGYGTYRWNTGDFFYGNWVDNKMEGFGYSKLANGSSYTGLYSNSKYHGNAYYINKETGKSEFNYYENGKFVKSIPYYSTGQTQGCTTGECANGYGKYIFNNSDLYMGDFQNGKMKVGTYVFQNGDIYTGGFNANNQFEGYGFYLFKASGNFYYGYWANGKRNGRGYAVTNNKEEVGEWKDNFLVVKMN